MSFALRNLSSRQSLPLSEHALNRLDHDNMTMPVSNPASKGRRRAVMSMGGVNIGGEAPAGPSRREGGDASPATRARSMRPRKSILKSLSARSLAQQAQDEHIIKENTTHHYAHTIAFDLPPVDKSTSSLARNRQSLGGRRVSFAPNMHVRYLQTRSESSQSCAGSAIPYEAPTPSTTSAHSRRSSQGSQLPNTPVPVNEHPPSYKESDDHQEQSVDMDVETDSEMSYNGDNAVDISTRRQSGTGIRFNLGEAGEEDAEGEEDMDVTQVVFGGIGRRLSIVPSEPDEGLSLRDDERTMDFTVAIGGVLPASPPPNASTARESLGYALPESPNSANNRLHPGQAMEGEVDDMDETIAIGGIIGVDESISSAGTIEHPMANREKTMTFSFTPQYAPVVEAAAADDDGMDMTIARGGILAYPAISPARPSMPSNTRPLSGTPSFARPTMASASKSKTTERRNVFAPSPSPIKSTTPSKGGMHAAEDVAKRLSFGSTTSSGGRKRARSHSIEDADHGDNGYKRARPVVMEGVFAVAGGRSPAKRKSITRKSVGFAATTKSPAKSPMLRRALGYHVDEAEEEVQERERDGWEPATITLAAFLEMAEVQFIEALPGLHRRWSSVGKGVLGQSAYGSGDRDYPLHEYSAAQMNSVFLNMYSWAANKMKDDIRISQAELAQAEKACDAVNPPVIREYLSATEEDRVLFEMTFKAFKANTQLKARERWYDWKMGLMERVRPDVEEMLGGMQEDKARLDEMSEQAEGLLPELHARFAMLQAELQKERELVAEIEECDQGELADLRAAVAEQTSQVDGFSAELQDVAAQLAKLEANLSDLNEKRADASSAIQRARSRCDQFTKSDVYRLQEEYDSIQGLHLWRIIGIQRSEFTLEYDGEIKLSIACREHVPDLGTAKVELKSTRVDDVAALATASAAQDGTSCLFGVFEAAVAAMIKSRHCGTLSVTIQRIGRLWSAAQRIRQELRYSTLLHPLTFSSEEGIMRATSTIMLPSQRSKVALYWCITGETLLGWPGSAAGVEVGVEVVYGNADQRLLCAAARESMSQASEEGYIGIFLQSCVDAAAVYA